MSNAKFDGLVFTEIKTFAVPAWDFESSPVLIGEFVKVLQTNGEFATPQYHFRTADDKVVMVWGSRQIVDAMEKVEVGEVARIEFIGTQDLKTIAGQEQRKMKLFKVGKA